MASGSMQRDIVVKSVTFRLVKAKGIEKSFQLSRHKNIAGGHIDFCDILVVNRLPAIAQRPLDRIDFKVYVQLLQLMQDR